MAQLDPLFNGVGGQAALSDHMGDNLRIGIGVEDSSLELQLLFQLFCIDQVAVVGHHHGALDMADHQGLGILRVGMPMVEYRTWPTAIWAGSPPFPGDPG